MASLNQKIFDIIKSVPHVDEASIHSTMQSVEESYSVASGNSAILRLLQAKYIRKDMNKRFVAHVDVYKPIPLFVKSKKKKVKANPAMNAYQYVDKTSPIPTKPKKSFFTKLRELFSD